MKQAKFHIINLFKHQIDVDEAYEALLDGWPRRRRDGANHEILGRTQEGRYIQLVAEDKGEFLWVFHGRDMNETEKKRYRKK